MCLLQEGEDGKEEEEKEFFGRLEYSLDYNFTDNQVRNAYTLAQNKNLWEKEKRKGFLGFLTLDAWECI